VKLSDFYQVTFWNGEQTVAKRALPPTLHVVSRAAELKHLESSSFRFVLARVHHALLHRYLLLVLPSD
jgi:hypothetical protein